MSRPEQGIYLIAGRTGTWSDDVTLTETAQARGVTVLPVSPMYLSEPGRDGLMLGFSGLSDEEADEGTRLLADMFRLR